MSDGETIEDLLDRIALGNRPAFEALYIHTSAKLFGISLRILGDNQEAEEALQDTYVKVWRKAGSYNADRAAGMSWLIAIARNASIDRMRRRREITSEGDSETYIEDENPSPEDAAVLSGEVGRLHECLDELDTERAEAIRQAFLGGVKYQDLADRMQRPLGTIKSMIRRGLMTLKQCMETGPQQG